MKTFIRDCLHFFMIQAAVVVLVLVFFPSEPNRYKNVIFDKHARLDEIPPPRIILLGGSSAAFGYDSNLIKKETGIEPVNMGLQAGFGLPFMLAEVRNEVKAGDIVVISPEYVQFPLRPTIELVDLVFFTYPGAMQWFDEWSQWKCLLDGSLQMFGGVAQASMENVWHRIVHGTFITPRGPEPLDPYNRAAFNEYGDVTAHWHQSPPLWLPMLVFKPNKRYTLDMVAKINAFADECKRRGATPLYIFPPYAKPSYDANKLAVDQTIVQIQKNLTIPMLNGPMDMVWPRDRFYDTEHHLTHEAGIWRTKQLIAALQKRGIGVKASPKK